MRTSNRAMNAIACMAGALSVAAATTNAQAYSTNVDHELKIYQLEQYGMQLDRKTGVSSNWKGSIPTSGALDAYDTLWSAMTACTADACANSSSARYLNSSTSVNTMLSTTTGFTGGDMAFFTGHNVSIKEWENITGYYAWRPYNTSTGQGQFYYTGDWVSLNTDANPNGIHDYGTSIFPYYYHQRGTVAGSGGIYDATYAAPSYAVFYAYNPLTSVLMGQDFKSTTWYSENTINQTTPTTRSGQLGGELEYFVGNGCQAVPAARYVTGSPGAIEVSDQARQIWKPSWRGMHLVMGHYFETYTSELPNMTNFANDLKAGVPLWTAYYNAHTCNHPSDPALCQPAMLAPRGTAASELWTSQVADPTTAQEAGTWTAWWKTGG